MARSLRSLSDSGLTAAPTPRSILAPSMKARACHHPSRQRQPSLTCDPVSNHAEDFAVGHRGEAVKQRPTMGLSPPALVGDLIVRPRLLVALAQAASCRLVRIAAPAGSGKTTLAALWHECLRADGNAVAWVTLDPADNEPVRWATRVAAAVEQAVPEPATSLGAVTGAALV